MSSKKLICFDMDGVIFEQFNFWIELHRTLGTYDEGIKLTKKYLHNNYEKLVEEVVNKLWKGRSAEKYYELVDSVKYNPGVKELFDYIKKNDYYTAIISAASLDLALRVKKDFGIDYVFANELVIKNNKITGEFKAVIGAGKEKKAEIVKGLKEKLGVSKEETIFIGDDIVDVHAFKEAGLSIAFNAEKEEVKKAADIIINSNNLAEIINYL